MLCQLSYTHHRYYLTARSLTGLLTAERALPGRASRDSPKYSHPGGWFGSPNAPRRAAYSAACGGWLAYRAAMSRAVAESGPGCGTKIASR